MTSKKLLTVTSRLALASICVAALAVSACDDKAQDKDTADVASLVDSEGSRTQAQKEAAASGSSKDGDKQPERASASSPGEATVTQTAPVDASLYLSIEDIPGVDEESMRAGALVGKAPSPTYGSVRFHPKPDSRHNARDIYGAALQVWKLDGVKAAQEKLERMREQYLGVDRSPKNAPMREEKAFLSSRAGITTYVFVTERDKAGYVAAVSCGQTTCPKGWANVRPMAEVVLERLENSAKLEEVREERQERAEKDAERARDRREELERRKEKQ